MEFSEVLKRRVSVRSYNGKEVEEEKIQKILEIMQLAPSAGCLEAYKIHVETSEDGIMKLAAAAGQEDSMGGAGCVMVFFADPEASAVKYGERGRDLYSIQDATLACAYAQLAAAQQGICSLWVGAFDDELVKKACLSENRVEIGAGEGAGSSAGDVGASASSVGNGLRPVAMLVLGYSDEKVERPERKGLKEVVF